MDKDTWKIEKDLCRCCHSEGSFRNLAEPCVQMGEEEIYCDMLRDSFDIDFNYCDSENKRADEPPDVKWVSSLMDICNNKLTPVPGNLCAPTYTICDTCIERLRDAATFKKQVQVCEKKFRDMYSKNIITAATPHFLLEVKQEPDPPEEYMKYELMPMDDGGDSDDDKASLGIKNNDSTDEDDCKLSLLETKKKTKTTQKKPKTTKAKKVPKKTKTKKEKPVEEGDKEDADAGEKKEKKETVGVCRSRFKISQTDYRRDGDDLVCSRCEKRYQKLESLKHHVKYMHYLTNYQCTCCSAAFKTQALLTVHKLEAHKIDDRIKCNACDAVFNSRAYLNKHMKGFHKLGRKRKCQYCDYEAYSYDALYKHNYLHRTVKEYHCGFCKKSFLRKRTLILHEKIHTGQKDKVCKQCGSAFVQKASLNYHMSKYHPDVKF